MPIIDADAHVVESEHTWDFLEGRDKRYRPITVRVPGPDGGEREHWAVDGRLLGKGPIAADDVTRAQQYMEDIEGRLRHMDELGIDVQVLYPTMALTPSTTRPEIEVALYKSYNRWLAEIWAKSNNRLHWAVLVPAPDMERSIEELEFGKAHGACAVYLRGVEWEKGPVDPYFYPLYEAAEALDLPICFHAASGSFPHYDTFADGEGFWRFKLPGINAFHSLLMGKVPDRFPNLRWGFVEISSQWVPYALHDFVRRQSRSKKITIDPKTVMEQNRFWVACQLDDDVPYVLSYAGESQLIMGTDYGHFDNASDLEALRMLKTLPGVSEAAAQRIISDNPAALYHV